MNENILVVGNKGSGAYVAFKHMILNEYRKSALIDSFMNEDLIKKLDKDNIDTFFYENEFDEGKIIKDKTYNKFFINCVDMDIKNSDILSMEKLVLRIGIDELWDISSLDKFFSNFEKILIFSSVRTHINKDKESLKRILPKHLSKYVDLLNGCVDEYILIDNECVEYKQYHIESNESEKMQII